VLEPLLFGEAALGDELNRAIGTDVTLIMLGFMVMSVYVRLTI
tara:strand:+ start:49 stop:177 length:129 start_codon:yes stop_codon:yes gene_type:complete